MIKLHIQHINDMTPHVFHQTFSKIFNFIEMYLYIRKNIIIPIKKLSLCNHIMIYKTIQSFKVLKTWEMKKERVEKLSV